MSNLHSADLSVVIVNWNTVGLLRECLASVYETARSLIIEVIVVDNASIDGSCEMVKEEYPNVRLIMNDQNLGFAKANNIAFKVAKGRHVVLLNSDTKSLANLFEAAVRKLDSCNKIGAIAPRIYNSDGTIQHPCYVSFPSLVSETLSAFYLTGLFANYNRFGRFVEADLIERRVAHATGACLFVNGSLLRDVGLLDDTLVFSYEDADLCRRICSSGYEIAYLPDAGVIHYGGVSLNKLKDKGVAMVYASKYRYFHKHHNGVYVFFLAVGQISSAWLKWIVYRIKGWFLRASWTECKAAATYHINVLRWHLSAEGRKVIRNFRSR